MDRGRYNAAIGLIALGALLLGPSTVAAQEAVGRGTVQPLEITESLVAAAGIEASGRTDAVQSAVASDAHSDWNWVLGMYLHAVDISGTNTVGDIVVPVEVGFGDLFNALKVPFSAHLEGRRDKWGFGADFLYILVGEEGVEPVPGVPIGIGGDFTIANVELFGTYRIGSPGKDSGGAFDILGGVRWRRLKLDIAVSGLPAPLTAGFNENWWDLLVGARYVIQVHPRAGIVLRADVGTDVFTFNGGVGFNAWRRLDLLVEYRYISINHEQGSGASFFAYDATEQGPLFGFALHF